MYMDIFLFSLSGGQSSVINKREYKDFFFSILCHV